MIVFLSFEVIDEERDEEPVLDDAFMEALLESADSEESTLKFDAEFDLNTKPVEAYINEDIAQNQVIAHDLP